MFIGVCNKKHSIPYMVEACLKAGDNTAVVINAPEGTFASKRAIFDENGRHFKILSIATCSGPNVNRDKISVLIEGEFASKEIYIGEV